MQVACQSTESRKEFQKFELKTINNTFVMTVHIGNAVYEGKHNFQNSELTLTLDQLQSSIHNHEYQNTIETFQTLKFTCCYIEFLLTNKQVLAVSELKQQKQQLKKLVQYHTDELAAKTKLLKEVTQKLIESKLELKLKKDNYNLQTKLDPITQLKAITEPDLIKLLDSDLFFPNLKIIDLGWKKGQNAQQYELELFEGEVPAGLKRPNYYLGDPALEVLAINGHKYPNLQKIDFGDNNIKDQGFKKLAENGQKFTNLQSIYIYDNQLKDEGLIELAQNSHKFLSLKELVLCSNEISDNGFKNFVEQSSKFNNLQELNFTSNKIGLEGARALAHNGDKFPNLKIINFRDNNVTDEGLTVLVQNGEKFPNLQELNLRSASITDVGFKVLVENGEKFPNLKEFYFHSNRITDEGLMTLVQHRQKLPHLSIVELSHNKITDLGINFLLEKRNHLLTGPVFHLSCNDNSFKMRQSLKGDQIINFGVHPKCAP